ncbi:MAG: hypothetical protein JJT90_14195 [Ectothiorhodospiraceae bacterium]|nr:hypothetical protein [Ectothiorhodospiraceae bacterium]
MVQRVCRAGCGLLASLLMMAAPGHSTPAGADDTALHPDIRTEAGQREILERIRQSPFPEPIVLRSAEESDAIHGDIHGIVQEPLERLAGYLRQTTHWCGMLFLHLNVKTCLQAGDAGEGEIGLYLGRRYYQEPDEADLVRFRLEVIKDDENLSAVDLRSDRGTLGAQDIRIQVQVVPLDDERSLAHMRYSVGLGWFARTSLRLYLRTIGRDRIGFTVIGTDQAGDPVHVNGLRGVIERNTVRFYLAMQAFTEYPEADQLQARLERWFELTDQYPEQLRELDRETYLDQKRREYENQTALQETLLPGDRLRLPLAPPDSAQPW